MTHPIRPALALLALPSLAFAQVSEGEPNATFAPAFENQTDAPALSPTATQVETWVAGLDTPWGIEALPDGGFLVTERPGTLRMVSADGTLGEPISGVPEVDAQEQGGLLDVAVRDDFAETRRVWMTYAKPVDGGTATAAATAILSEDGTALSEVTEIFVQEPPSQTYMHYGSRLAFEPGTDNVWITTGEHFTVENRQLAQDLSTTYGKIVRVNALDGSAPEDNPFVGEDGIDTIWSFGHRNIQGAAVDGNGDLWIIEHGPAGGDELNRPEAGLNYGWPVISYGINYDGSEVGSGEAAQEGMEQPVYYWDPVIAPGGMIVYDGDAFDWNGDVIGTGLVTQDIVRLELNDEGRVSGEERVSVPGRARDVVQAADGTLLVLIDAPAPDGAIVEIAPAE
ncbi:PQQ-dependent sugar dehydrogenase [Wenxinia saemankumensis]|uniref:Glucose/arabinose dehydrogenase, beta-propeller fold n=1 Tax=Wenxinia saemankumensis TaxID=1447782 RepID=A0A1M6FR86_9RHOB|nr:PQQ-dependent sugar dehydrogenase [Wenxinia saemankumensis]SHJ00119.1 Glucose/arabinose dehydrogenase, beta-propeller fold [Wenxinia saemankumensis]